MAMQWYLRGKRYGEETDEWPVEFGWGYARELFRLLGIEFDTVGEIRARDLRTKIEGLLARGIEEFECGGTFHVDGRVEPVSRSGAEISERRLRELLEVCEEAGDLGVLTWQ